MYSAARSERTGMETNNGTIIVPESGSAEGDLAVAYPTGGNSVAVGDYIAVETDGASTGVAPFAVTFRIRR